MHFKHLNGERSDVAIFHILKGRKSIQTVQDIHIFKLEKFYGISSFLNKKQFDEKIEKLKRDGKITIAVNSHYVITEKGLDWLGKNNSDLSINCLNGYKYERIAADFYERLILLIQTLTNSKMNNYSFIPVIGNRSTENWVKQFYRKTNGAHLIILNTIYKELSSLLSHCSEKEAEIFVDRLSGYHLYGLSINQLATAYGFENEDIRLMLTGVIHHILSMLERFPENFPLLSHMMKDLMNTSNLSTSAKITCQLLNNNYSISEIAGKRQLKNNTIYDHIVEIAYNDNQFPLENYVSKPKQESILNAIHRAESYKLKQIKNLLGNEFSYFEIRLVLAGYRNLLK
jgi:uncharacterized protein YpbB